MAAAWLAVAAAVVTAAPQSQLDDDDAAPDLYDTYNISERGMYLGSPCSVSCSAELVHVVCEPATSTCQCDPRHPVPLGAAAGCGKPKKLGEQCFYRQTCRAFDPHASCVQVNHNAYCQCDPGYHTTSHSRPTNRVFCTEDMVLLTADMPTLLGVASGIFVLAGLLCMVLHLYTRARYRPGTAPPPTDFRNTAGTVSGTRTSSRASSRSAGASEEWRGGAEWRGGGEWRAGGEGGGGGEWRVAGGEGGARRPGAARAAAIMLFSRAPAAKGSRRPSLSSVQSSSSSIRSYSSKRWEREREDKERRQMSMRLAQLHEKMAAGRDLTKPTPSPRSPNNSTDGLLPSLLVKPEQPLPLQGVDGPCSSSSLY